MNFTIKKNQLLLWIPVIFFLPCIGFSQQVFKIQIKVVDESDEPLPGALVNIYDSASNYYITDKFGFVGKTFEPGSYRIVVSYFGKKDLDVVYKLDHAQPIVHIRLEDAHLELGEVEVFAMRDFVSSKPGRLIVNVQNSPLSNSNNLWELISFTPNVKTTALGTVQVVNQRAAIYLDHQLINLTGEDLKAFMENLPAESIARIEVVHAPGASAIGGYPTELRITTLKGYELEGWKGSIRYGSKVNTFYHQFYGASVDVNFKKWSIQNTFNYNENYYRTNGELVLNTEALAAIENRNDNFGKNYSWNTMVQYRLTDKLRLMGNLRGIHNINNLRNISSVLDSITDNAQVSLKNQTLISSLGFVYQNDSSAVLAFQVEYLNGKSNVMNEFSIDEAANADIGMEQLYRYSPTWIHTLNYKVQRNQINLNMGIRYSALLMDLENERFDIDKNPTTKADYVLDEKIGAAYLETEAKTGKFNIRIGMRAEHTQASFSFKETTYEDRSFYRSFWSLLPSTLVTYENKSGDSFSLGFNRTVTRPDYFKLNPFRRYVSNMSRFEGDLNTRAQYDNTLQSGIIFSNGLSIFSGMQFLEDFISIYLLTDPNSGFIIQRYQNFDKGRILFTNISYTQYWSKRMGTILKSDFFLAKAQLDGVETGRPSPMYSFQVIHQMIIAKGWSNTVSFEYNGGFSDGFFEYQKNYSLNYSLQKKIGDTGMSFLLGINDITKSQIEGTTAIYNMVNYRNTEYRDVRKAYLTLSYRFGKQKLKVQDYGIIDKGDTYDRLKEYK